MISGMQALKLVPDFELQKMKNIESIKEYSDMLLNIAIESDYLAHPFQNQGLLEKKSF